MSKNSDKQEKGTNNMDDVGRLIHYAGARESVDPERAEHARSRVAAHWENVVAERRTLRRQQHNWMYTVAASLLLVAVTVSVLWQPQGGPGIQVAMVEKILGTVVVADSSAVTGAGMDVNSAIETGPDGRIALRMSGGQSLRVDTNSRLVVHDAGNISLRRGAIYIDTGLAGDPAPILVATALGTAQDVGTQFQVRLADDMLVVGVRDGLVDVAPVGQENVSVEAGRFLEVDTLGSKKDLPLQDDNANWAWIETVVPEFQIEGATLAEYLNWYAHERGLRLNWGDTGSAQKARDIVLSGSIRGASLGEGLQIVRQIAPFESSVDGDVLRVTVK